jgi:hypothetical protein
LGEIDISLSFSTTTRFFCGVAAPVLVLQAARDAESGRDRGARMAGSEVIVLRLRAPQELRHPAVATDRRERLAATGQHLVRIPLVPHVEYELVAGRIEDVVQRGQQLDGAQARRQVAARLGDGGDDLLAQLAGHLRHLLPAQPAEILRRRDLVQQPLVRHSSLLTA